MASPDKFVVVFVILEVVKSLFSQCPDSKVLPEVAFFNPPNLPVLLTQTLNVSTELLIDLIIILLLEETNFLDYLHQGIVEEYEEEENSSSYYQWQACVEFDIDSIVVSENGLPFVIYLRYEVVE